MSDLIIRKSHPIIEAGYKLSLAEQRIILLSLAKLDNRDVQQRKVTLSAIDFAKTFGVSEKVAYRDLLTASKKLYDGSIILKGEDETTEFRWIESRTRYHKGEGRISFEFSQKVMPYLFELDKQLGYTQYHLLSVSGFSSTYSIRLYELCKKLQGMKNTEVEIEEIRRMLMLGDKYKEFKILKRSVLTPSIAEINEKSDLLVSIEFIKGGRSVKGLKFSISSKKPANNTIMDTKYTHLTKEGLTKLKQRPQVKAESHLEGEYYRECIATRKADVERFTKEGRPVPVKAYEQLAEFSRKIGDKGQAKQYEKLAGKDKPKEPKIIQLPSDPVARFNYLWQERNINKNCWGLDRQGDSKIKLQELVELSQNDGISEFDRKQVQIALGMFLRKNPETGMDIFADIPRNEFNPDDYDTSSAVSDEDEQRIKAQQTHADIMEALLKELISLRSEVAELKKEKS